MTKMKIKECVARIILDNDAKYIYTAWICKMIKNDKRFGIENPHRSYISKLLEKWSKMKNNPLTDMKYENKNGEMFDLETLITNVRGYKINNQTFFRKIIKLENMKRNMGE